MSVINSASSTNWDVFISHANEDKESLVRPLADFLFNLDVRVWYDEMTLKVGDSLSRSIDEGLARSKFGIVVLSKAFLVKGWTEYELRGLLTKEIGNKAVILPIWHGVNREDIVVYSPSLADKKAIISTDKTIPQIGGELLERIRPDIYKVLMRRLTYLHQIQNAPTVHVPSNTIKRGPIRRKELSKSQSVRVALIYHILGDVIGMTLDDLIECLLRDLVPDDEIHIWERIALTFSKYTTRHQLNKAERERVFSNLLAISMGGRGENSSDQETNELLQLYAPAGKTESDRIMVT